MRNNALRNKPKNKKKIVQLSIENEFIKEWNSISEASSNYKVNTSAITQVLKGRTYISCGFKWQYKEDYDKGIIPMNPPHTINNKHIVQLSMDGKLISKFSSLKDASTLLNICYSSISNVCKGKRTHAGGFKWMYQEEFLKLNSID